MRACRPCARGTQISGACHPFSTNTKQRVVNKTRQVAQTRSSHFMQESTVPFPCKAPVAGGVTTSQSKGCVYRDKALSQTLIPGMLAPECVSTLSIRTVYKCQLELVREIGQSSPVRTHALAETAEGNIATYVCA